MSLFSNAYAYSPPLQDVQTWVDATNHVHYKVFDPKLGSWQEGSTSGYGSNLTTDEGIVTWIGNSNSVWYTVYDPNQGLWYTGSNTGYGSLLTCMSGIVVWLSSNNNVWYTSYDPQRESWHTGNTAGYGSNLTTSSGVITWLSSSNVVYYTVYDPVRGVWATGSTSGYSSGLTITVATVFWIDNLGHAQTRGFNCGTGTWNDDATQSFAYFIFSPALGNTPLWVWFTDMSVGATSWTWAFGDGQISTDRSTSHIYLIQGVYSVMQNVTGPGGNTYWRDTVIVQSGSGLEELSSLSQGNVLGASMPNPCQSYTTISYSMAKNAVIKLQIYSSSGTLVRKLRSGVEHKGINHVTWDGRDEIGHQVSNGIYFYRLEVENFSEMKKIIKIE